MFGYLASTLAGMFAGGIAVVFAIRRIPEPHPEHCPEVTWCSNCKQPTGARCPEHALAARAAAGKARPAEGH